MKMPSKSEFDAVMNRLIAQNSKRVAKVLFESHNEFMSIDDLSARSKCKPKTARSIKSRLTGEHGVCFCYIGNGVSRQFRMIGIAINGKGKSISEADFVASNCESASALMFRPKGRDLNISYKNTNTGNLLNKVFK